MYATATVQHQPLGRVSVNHSSLGISLNMNDLLYLSLKPDEAERLGHTLIEASNRHAQELRDREEKRNESQDSD